ncbi:MAG: phosphoribosylformylglycinamidine synthase [Lentisphaerae bacterium]|nr:phosphoribosylformylglycinamidine synthase [Lentisphaerota bacterium]
MKSTGSRNTRITDAPPLCLLGTAAFSAFRIQGLLERLQATAPQSDIRSVSASHVYLVASTRPLTEAELGKVHVLLGTAQPFAGQPGFFVTPRQGTLSPWSSKATDIFHNCGLRDVRRVERGIHYQVRDGAGRELSPDALGVAALNRLHDRMTQGVYLEVADLFRQQAPPPYRMVDVLGGGVGALRQANRELGLALSDDDMVYLAGAYGAICRNPTDVELVMFGQVNSEHCRHKIFNADWIIDGVRQTSSLFDMIRHTHAMHPEGTLVAYRDNSGVIEGFPVEHFEAGATGTYRLAPDQMDLIMKVETHNHPTAISPFPGAATGVGGEIRDEGATGTAARSKAGLSAFMVSHLRVPGYAQPWEQEAPEWPGRLASPLDIMLEGPIGGAGFGNEFGRPQLCGVFRTFEARHAGRYRGYHKPIMTAGGMGLIKRRHTQKRPIMPGSLIIQLGGPALRIGLGGGAASSMATGSNAEALDFDSVQRDNAEMQRRCQEVINACAARDDENPILTIHDIGAGGLSNGCPELVSETGGEFWLRAVPNEDPSMSPMEIWCCEAQERYVLAIAPASLEMFRAICERERCPMAVIGRATGDGHLSLLDELFDNKPIDIDLGVILGKPPRMMRDVKRLGPPEFGRSPGPDVAVRQAQGQLDLAGASLAEAVDRVLRFPAVANKTFLITITDRTVTGCVTRDQMAGPYQVPIADVAVTANSYRTFHGQAMAMGERTPVALISGPASGRLAIGEALTNIAAADVGVIGNVKLSGNWMCACGEPGEDAVLFDTVRAVGLELCPALGISIPVGKDSLSMRTVWRTGGGEEQRCVSPMSLVVSAFSPVTDVRRTLTPDLKRGASTLLLIDLGCGQNRLGGSTLAQVYNQIDAPAPDLDDPALFRRFFAAMQSLVRQGLLLAYHDRSDGGLLATLAEMAFGGRRGVDVLLTQTGDAAWAELFAEELGAVIQVANDQLDRVWDVLRSEGVSEIVRVVGAPTDGEELVITAGGQVLLRRRVLDLQRAWSELTWRMQSLRDNPDCARQEFENLTDAGDPGLSFHVPYEVSEPELSVRVRPRVAILREQGVNGQVEMAAAFYQAGFESVDVHMTDMFAGRVTLDGFAGLVACGGFSYGDVLGAGAGWAMSILGNDTLRRMFAHFFAAPHTFALGVCNGCQMMAQLKAIIPGADLWPRFVRNTSEQFEARLATVEILPSPSIFFRGMGGARVPVPVAHGEGRASFATPESAAALNAAGLVTARFVDNRGAPTERYPYNPNASPGGLTGVTTPDGRVTIMMPHPERAFRACQLSYRPANLFRGEAGPWLRMFQNARQFAG